MRNTISTSPPRATFTRFFHVRSARGSSASVIVVSTTSIGGCSYHEYGSGSDGSAGGTGIAPTAGSGSGVGSAGGGVAGEGGTGGNGRFGIAGSWEPPHPITSTNRSHARMSVLRRDLWGNCTGDPGETFATRTLYSSMSRGLAFIVICAACGGGGDDMGDDVGPGEQTSATALREVAAAIYDEVDARGDVASYVEGVFLAFDVGVYAEPTADLDARHAAGHPYLFE